MLGKRLRRAGTWLLALILVLALVPEKGRAVQDGVVTAAAYSPSYGNHLRILHPDGCETRYAHLQYLYVRPGEVVQAGQTLGTVGQTGRATGAHLHLELWQQGAACDPAALLETAP